MGVLLVGGCWVVLEEQKLLWEPGEQKHALRLSCGLLEDLKQPHRLPIYLEQ